MDIDETSDRPEWMGKVDLSGLKLKLITSIVAISGIHLLKRFMEIGEADAEAPFSEPHLRWLVIIHLTFVGGDGLDFCQNREALAEPAIARASRSVDFTDPRYERRRAAA